MQVYCPFCDGSGVVYKAIVTKLSSCIFICDECDTVWENGQEIIEGNCLSFKYYMTPHGLKPLWSELSNIEKEWE